MQKEVGAFDKTGYEGQNLVVQLSVCANLASTWPCKLDSSVPIHLPTGYSSLLRSLASFDKEWLADISKPPHLLLDDMLDIGRKTLAVPATCDYPSGHPYYVFLGS